ncbi:MAG: aminoacyl-tRNA hydrolase [Nitrospirota bacterium]
MKLIVGLGNPGPEYEATKHNVGFWVVDAFAETVQASSFKKSSGGALSQIYRGKRETPHETIDFLLVKPQTFMNRSGIAVAGLLKEYEVPLSDLIVITDDLDTECGFVRIRTKGSSGGHRGISSIIERVASHEFLRIKVGIGRNPNQAVSDYVLTPFSSGDREKILSGVERAVFALPLLLEGRIPEAMNRTHIKP